jgi:DoxX-like family
MQASISPPSSKAFRTLYWVLTGFLAAMMLMSGIMYFTQPVVIEGFQKLGFPPFLRIELAFAKCIGAIVLVAPLPRPLKECTYAGFGINFISAIIAHLQINDPPTGAAIALAVLIASRYLYGRVFPNA